MNGGSRHTQYRRKLQRKRRIRRTILIAGIVLILLLAGFLILGTLSADEGEPPKDTDNEQLGEGNHFPLPVSVKAHVLYLETADSSTLASRLQELWKQSVREVSVPLNRTDGSLLYSSSLADSLGLGSPSYSITIARAASQAKTNQMRLCGIWHLTAFEEKDPVLRSVRLSETAALLADAMKSGMHDILLLAPEISTESLEELLLLSEDVHRLYPDGTLGICIPFSFFEAEDSAILVDDLVDNFDFLAINATELSKEETIIGHVQSIASARLDLLLRYNMRLLLPYAADESEQAEIIAAAEQYSTKSWQILPIDP